MAGQIVDATLVAAPRQRNPEAEKVRIKAGEGADEIWPDKPAKARQKDVDARWTMKFSKAKPAADAQAAGGYRRSGLRLRVAYLDRPPARASSDGRR